MKAALAVIRSDRLARLEVIIIGKHHRRQQYYTHLTHLTYLPVRTIFELGIKAVSVWAQNKLTRFFFQVCANINIAQTRERGLLLRIL